MTDVIVTQRDGILHLQMDRPNKKNALTGAMYHALSGALEAADASDAVRAVLVSGNGSAFCAGNDLADFLSHGDRPAQEMPSVRLMLALTRFSKPLLAAVQGAAVGIGTTMLPHCDLVYAAPDARFSTPFARLGLVPEVGSSLLLPRRIGVVRANAMLLLGETLDATAALGAGLINAIVPPEALLSHATAQAAALCALSPQALRDTKRLLKGDPAEIERRIDEELDAFGVALRSDAAKAAFSAFLDRPRG